MTPSILHIRACNFFGGPEKQIMGHISASRNARHTILTFIERGAPNELLERCRQDGVLVETIMTKNPYNPSSILKLRAHLEGIRPDILCCHGYKPAILALLARVGLQLPMIVFARGHTNENLRVSLFEKLEGFTMRYAELVVSVSEAYVSNLLKYGVARDRIRVVRNAIDTSKIHDNNKLAEVKREGLSFFQDDLLICTAGRLSPEKAQADLIRAFSPIQKQFQKARLLIIGAGPLRAKLQRLADECGIQNVYFLGFRKDLDEILPLIDLFVLPSYTESLPNVVLEACACGKPIVATNVGGLPEIIEDGVNGILVPPRRPDLLAEAMEKCLSSPEMMRLMGEAAFRKVEAEFTLEAQTRRLEEIYNEVLQMSKMRIL